MISEEKITIQQAAEILNVASNTIVVLLENGEVPFSKIGSERRIQLTELLSYKKKMKAKRRANLDFLAKEAQELNLGYE